MQHNANAREIRGECNCSPRISREPDREGSLAGGIGRKIVSQRSEKRFESELTKTCYVHFALKPLLILVLKFAVELNAQFWWHAKRRRTESSQMVDGDGVRGENALPLLRWRTHSRGPSTAREVHVVNFPLRSG
jgi:hypothetical protein